MPPTENFRLEYGRLYDASVIQLDPSIVIQPTIITWQRLEPVPLTSDLSPSLQAQIADPLWLLARQWQFAEFLGEDAGSPVAVQLQGDNALLSRYRPGAIQAQDTPAVDYQHLDLPLEVMVEREALRDSHPRLAAEAGEHLLRLLSAAGVTNGRAVLRAAGFGLEIENEDFFDPQNKQTDPKGRAWQILFAGRALDGRKLADALHPFRTNDGSLSGLPDGFGLAATPAVFAACARWLDVYQGLISEPSSEVASAWIQERQEYALALSAQFGNQNIILTAEEYTDGVLDWYSFNADDEPQLGEPAQPVPTQPINFRPMLPAPVRYPGMPADRYWEFEDARVNLGQLDTGPGELGKLLLAEYGLVYGNDWFILPVELPVGSLFHVSRLTVRDTFGITSNVGPSRNLDGTRWTMFNLSNDPGGLAELYFLPPTLPFRLESDPLEEVALFRDEMANMAWAVEHIVQGAAGQARDRRMELPAPSVYQRITGDQITAELIYRLATPVPN